jgi:rubrerythrin
MSLKTHLKEDKEDEDEAIEIYGKRQRQHPDKAGMFHEMQEDEKDHKRKLSKAIGGLKKAHRAS